MMTEAAKLSRLQAFLSNASELEVVAHKSADKPVDYTLKFLRDIAVPAVKRTIVWTALGAALAAGTAPAQATSNTAPVSNGPVSQAAVDQTRDLYRKYVAHGHSDHGNGVVMVAKGSEASPMATALEGGCFLVGIRSDYTEFPALAQVDQDLMRRFTLIHEDMHCRSNAYVMATLTPYLESNLVSPVFSRFATITSEASADAMALLMTARRDGVDEALKMADAVEKLRVSTPKDTDHDTVATIRKVRQILKTSPQRFDSDSTALATAMEVGLSGATVAIEKQLPARDLDELRSPRFKQNMQWLADGLTQAVKAYYYGSYDYRGARVHAYSNGQMSSTSVGNIMAPETARPSAQDASFDAYKVRQAVEMAQASFNSTAAPTLNAGENPLASIYNALKVDPSVGAAIRTGDSEQHQTTPSEQPRPAGSP